MNLHAKTITRYKALKRLAFCIITLISLSAPLLANVPQAAAAFSVPSACENDLGGACIEVTLSGTIPAGIKVTAARSGNDDGFSAPGGTTIKNSYTLTRESSSSNKFFAGPLDPWAGGPGGGQSLCSSSTIKSSAPSLYAFNVTAAGGGETGTTSVNVSSCNVASGSIALKTSTNNNQPDACLKGTIYFQPGSGQKTPATPYQSDAGGAAEDNAGLTLNGTSTEHTTLSSDGKGTYSFGNTCNIVPGTYTITGNITDPANPTVPFPIESGNITIKAGPNTHDITAFQATGSVTAPGASGDSSAPTCLSTDGTGGGWALCQIFNATGKFSDFLFSNLVQPFLKTAPISTDPSDPTYAVWSTFRVYGDIFLVIGLLVIVFSEAIGGGLVDAYTAKKALPRLLVAAVLINLSIYIVALLVDITNVLGQGIGALMTAPLKDAGAFHITLNGVGVGKIGGISVITGLTVVALGFLKFKVLADAGGAILLFIIMPAAFGLLAAFVTLVLRKGIILALVMVSPVAFALYCLPNTEKYFKQWWDALVKTLLVYPIVIVFFAVADILSVTINNANGASSGLGDITAFLLQFLPLIFIPYAFRLAGGAVGRAHELLTNSHKRAQEAIKGNPNDPFSFRNRSKRKLFDALAEQQHDVIQRGRKAVDSTGRPLPGMRNRLRRARGRYANNFGNIDDRWARYNKEAAERRATVTGFGNDDVVYAAGGYEAKAGQEYFDGDSGRMATNNTGRTLYLNSRGKSIGRDLYRAGKKNYGSSEHDIVAALAYTTEKSQTDSHMDAMQYAFKRNAEDGGWDETLVGNYLGATYPYKGQFGTLRYAEPVLNHGTGKVRFKDLAADTDEGNEAYYSLIKDPHKTRQSYQLGQVRDQDWALMHERQQALEAKVLGGRATAGDKHMLAMTYEIFDDATTQMQVAPGADPSDNTLASGASPAAKSVIENAVKSRQLQLDTANTSTHEKSLTAYLRDPATGGFLTDPATGRRQKATAPSATGIYTTGDAVKNRFQDVV